MTPYLLDTFIYGGLSHTNENKKKEYDLWMINPFSNQIVTNEFAYILACVFRVIFFIRNLNTEVIEKIEVKKANRNNQS